MENAIPETQTTVAFKLTESVSRSNPQPLPFKMELLYPEFQRLESKSNKGSISASYKKLPSELRHATETWPRSQGTVEPRSLSCVCLEDWKSESKGGPTLKRSNAVGTRFQ